ncbi:MAG: FAD-dependent oxidoreductase [Actinomycetota bacterium]|nr:FAD-dependent oxidoreductase [Actinomycetota bacterium]
MAKVVVVGDGPAGLSAALFLAKNAQEVVVYAQDDTAMHYAELHNYLGIREIDGSRFQTIAREQAAAFGAVLREEEVTEVVADGATFIVRTNAAEERADYVVLAGGKPAQRLARAIGAETRHGTVAVDTEYRTGVDRAYAVGRVARPNRSQAIISAGAGATAALDILAREAGKDVTDWDTPSGD